MGSSVRNGQTGIRLPGGKDLNQCFHAGGAGTLHFVQNVPINVQRKGGGCMTQVFLFLPWVHKQRLAYCATS